MIFHSTVLFSVPMLISSNFSWRVWRTEKRWCFSSFKQSLDAVFLCVFLGDLIPPTSFVADTLFGPYAWWASTQAQLQLSSNSISPGCWQVPNIHFTPRQNPGWHLCSSVCGSPNKDTSLKTKSLQRYWSSALRPCLSTARFQCIWNRFGLQGGHCWPSPLL